MNYNYSEMNAIQLIEKYYKKDSDTYKMLIEHSRAVADKALSIAKNHPELGIDEKFVEEAAMIHDIGIYLTNAPDLHLFGKYPYICHGYLGREIIEKEGYPIHALVCERHTGTGISVSDIISHKLTLPHRDMIPLSIEEKLICFSDCFYSKTKLGIEKDIDKIRKGLAKFGEKSVNTFDEWVKIFL